MSEVQLFIVDQQFLSKRKVELLSELLRKEVQLFKFDGHSRKFGQKVELLGLTIFPETECISFARA